MDKQSIEVLGIQLLEPGTFISDLIMAVACYYFFVSLKNSGSSRYHKQCSFFFLFMSASSLTGAFAHGLFDYTGKSLHFVAWLLTGIAVYFFELGISSNILNQRKRETFIILIKSQLVLYVILTAYFMNFITVKINTSIGLLGIVSPVLLVNYIKFNKKYYLFVLSGILLAVVPAFMHKVKFNIVKIFNMNDLSHFFLIFCLYLIYSGLRKSFIDEPSLMAEKAFN